MSKDEQVLKKTTTLQLINKAEHSLWEDKDKSAKRFLMFKEVFYDLTVDKTFTRKLYFLTFSQVI